LCVLVYDVYCLSNVIVSRDEFNLCINLLYESSWTLRPLDAARIRLHKVHP
jgi:hypothetical protein